MIWLVLLLLANPATGLYNRFELCDENVTDHLGISNVKLTPQAPIVGHLLAVALEITPRIRIDAGEVELEALVHDYVIVREIFNFCDDFKFECPLNVGRRAIGEVFHYIPEETPTGVELVIKLSVKDCDENVLSCVRVITYIEMMQQQEE